MSILRVLFLADAVFEDLPGGSRVVARELAQRLVQRGHEVTILAARLTPQAPATEERDGVRIVRYAGAGNPARFVRLGQRACAELFAEQGYDVVHTHFAYAGIGPLRAVPRSVPRIRTFHGPWDEEGWIESQDKAISCLTWIKERVKKQLRYRIERNSLRDSDRIIVLSDCFRRELTERFHIPGATIRKIVGGVDIERFQPAAHRPDVRRALGLPENRRILLSVRRLVPRMGLTDLIRAMPQLVASHPDLLLVIGGTGPEREHMDGLIKQLKMEHYVQIVGFIPDAELAAYYQSADLFVLPTLALEGFGLVTVEALACGTPVIGTPVGATPEILSALDPRLITAGTGPQALFQGISSFLTDDWACRLTPSLLQSYVLSNYTWEKHVRDVEQLYHQALDAH